MDTKTLIINGIFYTIVTTIFLILFIKDKTIGKWIKAKRDKLADKFIVKIGWNGTVKGYWLKRTIAFVEVVCSALILVLIIQRLYLGHFVIPTGSMEPTIKVGDRVFGDMVVYNFRKPKREEIIVFDEPIENKVLYTKRLMGLPGEKVFIKNSILYVNDTPITTRNYSDLGELEDDRQWIIPKKGDIVKIIPGENYREIAKTREIDIEEIQKNLLKHPGAIKLILPEVEFKVNGEKTGMLLDFVHDKDILNKLLKGETVTVTLNDNYYFVLGDNTDNSADSRFWGFVKESRIKGKPFVRFWPLNRMGLVK